MKDTKNHILEISFGLFLQKSFKEVTMTEIVKATGLSKGAFYHYFSSKEQLFTEIVDVYYLSFFYIDYSQFDQDNLKAFYSEYLAYIGESFEGILTGFKGNISISAVNFYLMIFDAIHLYPGFRDKVIDMSEKELRSWTAIISRARQSGEIDSPMTDEQIARVFTNTNDGIAMHAIIEGRVNKLVEEIREVFDGFYEEIRV